MAPSIPDLLHTCILKTNNAVPSEDELTSTKEELGYKCSVRGIKELVDAGINHVPSKYMRPVDERPRLSEVSYADQVPVIDLQGLLGDNREQVIQEIARASEYWGLFQVVNHGVPTFIMKRMQMAVEGFFQQPANERMMYYSEDVQRPVVYVTSFNQQREKVLNWKDSLRFRYSPGLEGFNELPPICRIDDCNGRSRTEPTLEYCQEIRGLGGRLYAALSESLGLSPDCLENYMQGKVANIHVNMHYYPPCPDPDLTLGLSGHSDPNVITVLMQNQVEGLQVFKDGVWIAVKPVPDALVVTIGDQLQILTNGKYKSAEHRVITNSEKSRISIPTFFGPWDETKVGPLPEFIDDNHPALYKETIYKEYVSNFYNKGLARKSSLDFASLTTLLEVEDGTPAKATLSLLDEAD